MDRAAAPSSKSDEWSKRRESVSSVLKRGHDPGLDEERRENKLYVGNLDHRVTEYHVIRLFSPFGKIRFEDYMWHTHGPRRGEPRGFAFVEYCKREDAETAKTRMNGRLAFGRPLVVRFVDEKVVTEKVGRCSEKHSAETAVKPAPSPVIGSKIAKIMAIQNKLNAMDQEGRRTKVPRR